MRRGDKEYDFTKSMLNTINRLNEEKDGQNKSESDDAIAITDDPRFGENVLTNQISAFRQAVNGGAKFSKQQEDNTDAKSNPLVYFPKTGNLIFSGAIPTMGDLKFQFSLNDVTNAPYIFVDGLALTEEAITTINKIRGYYLNWKDEWFASNDLLEKLGKK